MITYPTHTYVMYTEIKDVAHASPIIYIFNITSITYVITFTYGYIKGISFEICFIGPQ